MRYWRRPSLFWTLQLGGWGAFAVAMSLSRMGTYPLGYMVIRKSGFAVLGLLVTLGLRKLYSRLLRDRAPLWHTLGASVVASYVVSLGWSAVYNTFSAALNSWYLGTPSTISSVGRLLGGAVYNAFALLAWSVLYIGIKYHQALQVERERAIRAEALASKAALQALRYQLNPHFLFNSMNAISTLIVEGRNAEADRMLVRLSSFLRLTLQSSDAQRVPLSEEIAFARSYLEIEQVRFGERLKVRVDVREDAVDLLVPTLILQPIVENAIRYAVAPSETGGRVEIDARRDRGFLLLRVRDDGPGLTNDDGVDTRGIGLRNTRERLQHLYDGRHRFELGECEGGGLAVTISIPLDEAAS